MDDSLLVEAVDIGVALGGRDVLSNAALRVRAGEIVTLIGPNGAGKTTLARTVLGLVRADKGTVFRRPNLTVGYAPQNLKPNPFLPMTVERFLAVSVPRSGAGLERRAHALDDVGAGHILHNQLTDISGGELQRVMLARALLREPDLLVLDEPAQGVDVGGQADLYRLIGRIREMRGCGILLVSHDLHLVMAATDHVICLNRHVCCAGHPRSVARDPAFAALFGARVAADFAVYQHHHDHVHDADGAVVPTDGKIADGKIADREITDDEADHG